MDAERVLQEIEGQPIVLPPKDMTEEEAEEFYADHPCPNIGAVVRGCGDPDCEDCV